MKSYKAVTPMNTGIRKSFNWFKKPDAGLGQYDDKAAFLYCLRGWKLNPLILLWSNIYACS